MTEKDKQVAESFGNLLPKLSELDKERLLMLTALCRPRQTTVPTSNA